MKKLLSLALALAICLGLTVPALAAGNPGDTTIEVKGHTVTLSNPILYTFSSDAAHQAIALDPETLNAYYAVETERGPAMTNQEALDFVKPFRDESLTAYAIPSGTKITFPDDYCLDLMSDMVVSSKDGSYYSNTFVESEIPGYIDVTLTAAETENDLLLLNVVKFAKSENGEYGIYDIADELKLMVYIPNDASAPNPFANVKIPETPAAPEVPTASTSVAFTDVAADAFYAAPVAWAVEKDITKGTSATTFTPNGTCKIEQILTFLWRAAGSPASTAPCPFAGLDQSSPYYPALCWASEKGILLGEAKAAGKDCTRLMAVDFMYRYANSPAPGSSAAFTDVPAGHIASVDWAVENNVTNGTGNGKFSPGKTCTRGEIVTFLYRAFSEK